MGLVNMCVIEPYIADVTTISEERERFLYMETLMNSDELKAQCIFPLA